jgi:hypothetical protein
MKTPPRSANRFEIRRLNTLRRLAQIGPFIKGTVCSVRRRGCRQPGWQLTFKTKGKTRTVYVPMDLAPEVRAWSQEYKRLKKLARQVTTHSLAIIRRHVAVRRAVSRNRASTSR